MAKSIEDKFKEQEEKLGLLAKGLIDAIWVVDLDSMKYTYISSTVEEIRGYSPEEAMALTLQQHLTPKSFQDVTLKLVDALKKYESDQDVKETMEVEMYHKEGHTVWIEITARLANDNDGGIKAIGVTKNISQRKFFEQEREKLIEELSVALEEQKRLRRENRILRGLLPICADCKKSGMMKVNGGRWKNTLPNGPTPNSPTPYVRIARREP